MNDFWNRIDKLLIDRRLFLKDLYTPLGMHQQSFSRWRSRNFIPSADKVLIMARTLGVTMEYLLTGEELKVNPLKDLPSVSKDELRVIDLLLELEYDRFYTIARAIEDQLMMQQLSNSQGLKSKEEF